MQLYRNVLDPGVSETKVLLLQGRLRLIMLMMLLYSLPGIWY